MWQFLSSRFSHPVLRLSWQLRVAAALTFSLGPCVSYAPLDFYIVFILSLVPFPRTAIASQVLRCPQSFSSYLCTLASSLLSSFFLYYFIFILPFFVLFTAQSLSHISCPSLPIHAILFSFPLSLFYGKLESLFLLFFFFIPSQM